MSQTHTQGEQPNEKSLNSNNNLDEENFDLIDLFNLLYNKKIVILLFMVFTTIGGLIYLSFSTPYYKSSIIFATPPENLMTANSGASDLLGGVGSVLGVGGKTAPATAYNLSILESRRFLTKFFIEENLMPELLAKYWDKKNTQWIPMNRSFLGKIKDFILGEEPNFIENDEEKRAELAYDLFKDLISINIDKETDIITFNIEWRNPILASKWANRLLERLNESMRARTILQSQERVIYLQKEIDSTKIANVKNILFNMMENELKTSMLANVQKDYSFTIIDSAYPSARPFRPRKVVILVLCLLGGILLGSLYIMSISYVCRLREAKVNIT